MADPEIFFHVTFGGFEPGESVADFAFCCGPEAPCGVTSEVDAEAAWLSLSVLFLSSRGRISVRNPVVPALAVLPGTVLQALAGSAAIASEEAEWLQSSLLRSGTHRDLPGGFVALRHRLHLHGGEMEAETYRRHWVPKEQVLVEVPKETSDGVDRAEPAPPSPRSPRHQRSTYCSIQLVSHSPVAVIARGTTSGLVELLVLSGSLGASFALQEAVNFTIFEEVDLVLAATKSPFLRLTLAPPQEGLTSTLVVRSRCLVAAIELPWLASLLSEKADLSPSQVTTLAEVKAADGKSAEFVAWQVLPALREALPPPGPTSAPRTPERSPKQPQAGGFLLRLEDSETPTLKLQSLAIHALLAAAGKARAAKSGADASRTRNASPGLPGLSSGAVEEDDSFRRHLSAPMLSDPIFSCSSQLKTGKEVSASDVATAVAAVRGGQVASLAARQQLLQHLAKSLPSQAKAAQKDLAELRKAVEDPTSGLSARATHAAARVEALRQRQVDLAKRQEQITVALAAELELRGLDTLASEQVPKLWAQLHELRRASELLQASAADESLRSFGDRQSELGKLQQAWAGRAADHLDLRASQVEAAVAAASAVASRA